MNDVPAERRSRQRVMTAQPGLAGFWLKTDTEGEREGERWKVLDLSLDGCGIACASLLAGGQPFPFVLSKEGSDMLVRGQAIAVNCYDADGEGQCGCRFVELEQGAYDILWAWLTRHIIDAAAIPLRQTEADDIIAGPSRV